MAEPIDVYKFSSRKGEVTYPNITVLSPNKTTPLIVGLLKEGEMPLILELNGDRKIVKRISISAYNIDWMLRTCGSLRYRKSENEETIINSIEDYLEVLEWTY